MARRGANSLVAIHRSACLGKFDRLQKSLEFVFSGSDQIATIVISAGLAGRGHFTAFGNHFGLLRSLEEIYGLGYLANAASAANGDIKSLL